MQIILADTDDPNHSEPFIYKMLEDQLVHGYDCPLCLQRPPVWFVNDASDAATNPSASPTGSSMMCTVCLNRLIDDDTIFVSNIDPQAF